MQKGILQTVIQQQTVQHNIWVLDENITSSDFLTLYQADKAQAMSFIIAEEVDVVPAKIYKMANEEFVKVEKILVQQNNIANSEEAHVVAVLEIVIKNEAVQHNAIAILEHRLTDFLLMYKQDRNLAIASFAVHIENDIHSKTHSYVEWVITNITPIKKKKRSAKEVEADLQGVELGLTNIKDNDNTQFLEEITEELEC